MSGNYLRLLRSAILDEAGWHKPWTSGVVELSGDSSYLTFNRPDGTTHRVNLATSITYAEGEDIMKACQVATFGRGGEVVHDESYRKAGKLDTEDFSWSFDPSATNITSSVIQGLFPWGTLTNNIRFEPYKLNVYGKGSFFKSHIDTPRAQNMFGSLVLSLPYSHQGGNLILYQKNELPFIFNGPASLRGHPAGSVAWVAFYSDVEHEVTEVTDGHRVTITYNLYFDLNQSPPSGLKMDSSMTPTEHPFKTMLKRCLDDQNFVKNERYLGFALERLYPGALCGWDWKYNVLAVMSPDQLKEPDSVVFQTLRGLGCKPHLRFLFRDGIQPGDNDLNVKDPGYRIMLEHLLQWEQADDDEQQPDVSCLMSQNDARIVWLNAEGSGEVDSRWLKAYEENEATFKSRNLPISWVVSPNDETVVSTAIAAYGNEPSVQFLYYQMCLLVDLNERD